MKKHEMAKKMKDGVTHHPSNKANCSKCMDMWIDRENKHAKQKGKMSLESVGKNEGEKHYLGKNEEPVA